MFENGGKQAENNYETNRRITEDKNSDSSHILPGRI